jgi:hypothetical protein
MGGLKAELLGLSRDASGEIGVIGLDGPFTATVAAIKFFTGIFGWLSFEGKSRVFPGADFFESM